MACRRYIESEFNPVTLRSPRHNMKSPRAAPVADSPSATAVAHELFDLTQRYSQRNASPRNGNNVAYQHNGYISSIQKHGYPEQKSSYTDFFSHSQTKRDQQAAANLERTYAAAGG